MRARDKREFRVTGRSVCPTCACRTDTLVCHASLLSRSTLGMTPRFFFPVAAFAVHPLVMTRFRFFLSHDPGPEWNPMPSCSDGVASAVRNRQPGECVTFL